MIGQRLNTNTKRKHEQQHDEHKHGQLNQHAFDHDQLGTHLLDGNVHLQTLKVPQDQVEREDYPRRFKTIRVRYEAQNHATRETQLGKHLEDVPVLVHEVFYFC